MELTATQIADVSASGIRPEDLRLRPLSLPELAATAAPMQGVEGYVIPYFTMEGDPLAFYRVKLLNYDPKYKQPKNTVNHLYFPPTFKSTLEKFQNNHNGFPYPFVVITEGEKKAACLNMRGIPTVAVGGVYSWRNKTLVLPRTAKLKAGGKNTIKAVLPSSSSAGADSISEQTTLAEGFQSLIDYLVTHDMGIVIAFDTDFPAKRLLTNGQGTTLGDVLSENVVPEMKVEVQRAAASLGYELRFAGLKSHKIRQLILRAQTSDFRGKLGLDDYIVKYGMDSLTGQLEELLERRTAFPRHPSPKQYVTARLERGKMSRREKQEIAYAIMVELDNRGRRLKAPSTNQSYYFDEQTSRLYPAQFQNTPMDPIYNTSFGRFLYQEFGLSAADTQFLAWLGSAFTGEAPIEDVTPRRILTLSPTDPDCIALQISDSQFALVTPYDDSPIEFMANGEEGILFAQDQVEEMDIGLLQRHIKDQLAQADKAQKEGTHIDPWWLHALEDTNLKDPALRKYFTALCYIAPWMQRWRGAQLPVEIVYGEANSGKSSLFMLRLAILTGRPFLRNMPTDMRDWYAGITNSGGMYVIDNVQFTDKSIRQRLSDDICRLITEPNPHIESRKLYTTAEQLLIPVRSTFGFTAIQQPFMNSDLIQRAAIFQMEAHQRPVGRWDEQTLARYGGREAWVAHHLVVLHKILRRAIVDKKWADGVSTNHRLSFFEQTITIACDVLGLGTDWVSNTMKVGTEKSIAEADWTVEAIKAFCDEMRQARTGATFTASDIADWAATNEEFEGNQIVVNARRLGRYIMSHKLMLYRTAGLEIRGIAGNRQTYCVGTQKNDGRH